MIESLPKRIGRALIRRHKGKYWELDFGRIAGKRFRLFCRTATGARILAQNKTAELKEHGRLAIALTQIQRVEAALCFQKLAPLKLSLTEIVDKYLEQHPGSDRGKSISDLIDELAHAKLEGKRRKRYVVNLIRILRGFAASTDKKRVASITAGDIEAYISQRRWGPTSQKSFIQSCNVLFNFAKQHSYLAENPCKQLSPRVLPQVTPPILSVEQAANLLQTCLATSELNECVPYIAVGLFAGLRPQELNTLSWGDINFTQRTISLHPLDRPMWHTRAVDMQANLVAWISPFSSSDLDVTARPVRSLRLLARKALGLPRWPQDILRHTFAAYHIATHKDVRLTALQMGCKGYEKLFVQYRILASALTDPPAFWNIYPPVQTKKGRPASSSNVLN